MLQLIYLHKHESGHVLSFILHQDYNADDILI